MTTKRDATPREIVEALIAKVIFRDHPCFKDLATAFEQAIVEAERRALAQAWEIAHDAFMAAKKASGYDVEAGSEMRGLRLVRDAIAEARRALEGDATVPNCGRCMDRPRCIQADKCADAGEGDDDSRCANPDGDAQPEKDKPDPALDRTATVHRPMKAPATLIEKARAAKGESFYGINRTVQVPVIDADPAPRPGVEATETKRETCEHGIANSLRCYVCEPG